MSGSLVQHGGERIGEDADSCGRESVGWSGREAWLGLAAMAWLRFRGPQIVAQPSGAGRDAQLWVTGVTGLYQIDLDYVREAMGRARASDPGGPTIFNAPQSQLGESWPIRNLWN